MKVATKHIGLLCFAVAPPLICVLLLFHVKQAARLTNVQCTIKCDSIFTLKQLIDMRIFKKYNTLGHVDSSTAVAYEE